MIKHYNIPIFLPERSCPNRCIFCNQHTISGQQQIPSPKEAEEIIIKYLSSIDINNSHTEIAFFGGNFTGIDIPEQNQYLSMAQKYLNKGIKGIRISTRPDYINQQTLDRLKSYNVTAIELGAQSFDDKVLLKSGRGHTAEQTRSAAKLINEKGFELGLQMMPGLPGDTPEKTYKTAEEIIKLGASTTRIYPALVIKDTELAVLYNHGLYTPLSLQEAVDITSRLFEMFENAGITILKAGLHPSESFLSGDQLIAGPFHISFRELVLTKLWNKQFSSLSPDNGKNIDIFVNNSNINYAVGYNSSNKLQLLEMFRNVKFHIDNQLTGREFYVRYS